MPTPSRRPMRRRSHLWAILLLWDLPAVLLATTLTLQPDGSTSNNGDAFLSARSSPTDQTVKNYGGAGAIVISAPGLSKGELQSLLRFDAAAVKSGLDAAYGDANWTMESIKLQFTVSNP